MKTADDVSVLMAEIGPLDDEIEAVVQVGDEQWLVRFRDVEISVELDEVGRRLMLSTPIGAPPPSRAASVYETVLTYAALWRDTGGVRVALTQPGGELMQMVDVFADDASPASLVVIIVNLGERAAVWRSYVTDGPEAQTASPLSASITPSNYIRI